MRINLLAFDEFNKGGVIYRLESLEFRFRSFTGLQNV